MLEQKVFVLADRALNDVVGQIKDEQWELVMPPDFLMGQRDGNVTLRTIIGYHAYDEAWVPDMLAGRTMAEVGEAAYKNDLLGDDPRAAFSALVDRGCAAAEALDDPQRTVHCSFGDFTAQQYLQQVLMFRGFRAHDIAKVIGADTRLPDELVTGMWEVLKPNAEEWRAIGVFPAAVEVPADAALQDRLLGLSGRQPDGAY